MKTFFLLLIGAIVAAFVMTCSSVYAGQSEKQVYCKGLANLAGQVAQATHNGVPIKILTDDTERALAESKFTDETKSAIRAAVTFAIMMASQHNVSAELIAKYQYYGCMMST